MSQLAQSLFSMGIDSLRLQAQPSQVELAEMDADLNEIPPFRLSCSEVDRLAGIDFEARTEAQRNCPARIQRHE